MLANASTLINTQPMGGRRRASHDDPLWLTTGQAVQRLGVKPETLYAYVSRGLLTSRRTPDGRGSLFHRDDIARLATRGRRGRRRPRDQPPQLTIHSALTELADGQLRYRGRDAPQLASHRSFEEVAELLWGGEFDDTRPWRPHPEAAETARRAVATLPAATPPLEQLRVACGAAASIAPAPGSPEPAARHAAGRALIATLVAALPLANQPASASAAQDRGGIARQIWERLTPRRPTRAKVGLVNAALVLLADHELAASTLSARIAASAGCDPYAVVECGLAAASGTRHGRSTLAAEHLLADLSEGDPDQRLAQHLREHGALPGFGHRIYQTHDPRATTLLQLLRDTVGADRLAAVDATTAAATARGIGPVNVDLALAALTITTGMPQGSAEAIFALARCAGWLAHAFEQYNHGRLIRPRALYIGPAHPEPAHERA